MWRMTLDVDYNGIVMFDPSVVRAWYGDSLSNDVNLFRRYITTDEGDRVLSEGLFVPVLAIDDCEYDIIVRYDSEPSVVVDSSVIHENGIFALKVVDCAVVADLAALVEWEGAGGGQIVPVQPGLYAVHIRAFCRAGPGEHEIVEAGYEFVLRATSSLPRVTGQTGAQMRVLD